MIRTLAPRALLPLTLLTLSAPALADRVHTPRPGSSERKEIVEGLRATEGQDRIYVIRRLKVKDGFAVITVDPQSRDGTQHYERETAVMHYETGIWTVTDYYCTEADQNADGTCNQARARKRLGRIYGFPLLLLP